MFIYVYKEYNIKQEMSNNTYAPMTFDLVTPKSIGVIY